MRALNRLGWMIAAGIGVLLLIAFGSLWMMRGTMQETEDYLNENTPAGVVHDAFIAQQRGDVDRLEGYLTHRARESIRGGTIPLPPRDTNIAVRLHISGVRQEEDRAWVDVTVTHFSARGPFNRSEWSSDYTVPLVREDGKWRIDQYFPLW